MFLSKIIGAAWNLEYPEAKNVGETRSYTRHGDFMPPGMRHVRRKDRAAMVWSSEDGDVTLVRCSNSKCSGGSQQLVGENMAGPSIAAGDAMLSVVGRTPWSTIRKVDCASSCGSATTISATSHDAGFADVSFIGDRHSMVAYVTDRNILYFIDCPSSCASPTSITRGVQWGSASIAGGNDQAFVSFQERKDADLGLAWIHRTSQWGF